MLYAVKSSDLPLFLALVHSTFQSVKKSWLIERIALPGVAAAKYGLASAEKTGGRQLNLAWLIVFLVLLTERGHAQAGSARLSGTIRKKQQTIAAKRTEIANIREQINTLKKRIAACKKEMEQIRINEAGSAPPYSPAAETKNILEPNDSSLSAAE